jgi:hypothetical protein
MKHYLFIKDTEAEHHLLFVIKTIWRERDIIYLSKIMKLGIICYQILPIYRGNMEKMRHYPLSKVEKSNITDYKGNTKRWEIICLSKIMKSNITDLSRKYGKEETLPVIPGREVKYYRSSR